MKLKCPVPQTFYKKNGGGHFLLFGDGYLHPLWISGVGGKEQKSTSRAPTNNNHKNALLLVKNIERGNMVGGFHNHHIGHEIVPGSAPSGLLPVAGHILTKIPHRTTTCTIHP